MDGIEQTGQHQHQHQHLDQQLSSTSTSASASTSAPTADQPGLELAISSSAAKPTATSSVPFSSGTSLARQTRAARRSSGTASLATGIDTAAGDLDREPVGPIPPATRRRSARISLGATVIPEDLALLGEGTSEVQQETSTEGPAEQVGGKRKRRSIETAPLPPPVPTTDRKGKKKAINPGSSPLTDISTDSALALLPSEVSDSVPVPKRARRSLPSAPLAAGSGSAKYSLRSRGDTAETPSVIQPTATASSSKSIDKGKGKAPVPTRSKMPKKSAAPAKPRKGGASGSSADRSKKGDHTPKQLMDDSLGADESQWTEDSAGPSRSRLRGNAEDEEMGGSDHDEEHDDEDDEDHSEDDEDGPAGARDTGMPSGLLRGSAYDRLSRLAGESGMHLDEATAMALFGGNFRAFGGMMSGMSNRFKRLKANLRSKNRATRLSALRECSELLLVSNEDTLGSSFSVNNFAAEFIAILKGKPNVDEDSEDAPPDQAEEMDEDAQLAAALALSTGGDMPAGFGGGNDEMECQLVACRCLAHLMEALPGSGHTLVHLGAVPVLCSKLNEISYIELAEQTLSTMEKISAEYPAAIAREGGLGALLNYLPFFSTNVQRTAVTAAANCCRNISSEHYAQIKEVFPTLRDTLTQGDQRLVEQATLAVVRIIESYRQNAEHLEGLLDVPAVVAVNALLMPSGGSPLISPSTYTHLIRSLTSSAKCSAKVTIALLEAGMTNTVYQILTGVLPPAHDEDEQGESAGGQGLAGGVADMAVLQNLAHRPKDQVEETLALICELLPPTPRDDVFDPKGYSEKSLHRIKKGRRSEIQADRAPRRSSRTADSSAASTDPSTPVAGSSTLPPTEGPSPAVGTVRDLAAKQKKEAEANVDKRLDLLKGQPLLVGRFIRAVVPVLVDVYAASVSARVRQKVLTGLVKAVGFASAEELRVTLQAVPLASFLGAIISSKDNQLFILSALQLVELLVVKLPDVYKASFQREGVVFEIEAMAKLELSTVKAKAAADNKEKEKEKGKDKDTADVVVKSEPVDPTEISTTAPLASSSTGPPVPVAIPEDLKPLLMASGLPITILDNPSPSARKPTMDLADANILRARVLIAKKLFDLAKGEKTAATEVLDGLSALSRSICLPEATDGELRDSLRQIAAQFSNVDHSLSSFELLKSGLIDGILQFVDVDGVVSSTHRRELLYEVFSDAPSASSSTPLAMLVKRLHESLGRLEAFEVETAFNGLPDTSRASSSGLGRVMRIRLVAAEGQDVPKQVASLTLTIQAIAKVQSLGEYLRPRVADANYISASGMGMFASYGGGIPIPRGGGLGGGASRLLSALTAASTGAGASASPNANAGASGSRSRLGGVEGLLASSAPESRKAEPQPSTSVAGSSAAAATVLTEQTAAEKPQRRRSARLSAQHGKSEPEAGDDIKPAGETAAAVTAAASSPALPLSSSAPEHSLFPSMPLGMGMDMDFDDEDYSDEYDDEVFEEDMEEELARPAEKVVNMSLAPDGSKVEAKTPDGTRVATPNQAAAAASGTAGASTSGAATPRTASYAGAVKTVPTDWHLEFTLDGNPVSMQDTIYGAVHRRQSPQGPQGTPRATGPGGSLGGSTSALFGSMGTSVVFKFKKVDGPAPSSAAVEAPTPASATSHMPSAFDSDAPTSKILRLLRVVHGLCAESRAVSDRADAVMEDSLFVNNKLTAKLTRQLEETMIVAGSCLPEWAVELPKHFSFLFPFETRYAFLQANSFGYGRLIMRTQAAAQAGRSANNRREDLSHLSRIVRQKVRISRGQLLESAAKVLELYGVGENILEVEYFDEIGTGLGPTLEFYSLASMEFARRNLKLWRDEDETKAGNYVFHPRGLFPAPLTLDTQATTTPGSPLHWFKTLGLFAGRALLDSRIVDLHLNKVFLHLILGQPIKKSISTLKMVDPALARSLKDLQTYAEARREIEALKLPASTRRNKLLALTVSGANLADLSLDFTLPGYNIELKPGGALIDVDDSNVEEYLELVLDKTLSSGIMPQVRAFQEGFSSIFPVQDMRIFAPEELGLLLGNADEDWSKETIEHSIKADHGYTLESRAVQNLVDVMSSYDKEQRRQFLQFITGAPRLPIGGFRGLNPQFTVVRKPHEAPFRADDYLPSVMTCAQYLKMPDYSTKEVLANQLHRAMSDGGGSFHLS